MPEENQRGGKLSGGEKAGFAQPSRIRLPFHKGENSQWRLELRGMTSVSEVNQIRRQ